LDVMPNMKGSISNLMPYGGGSARAAAADVA
jgi:hypothetical protein